jgi:hypothetical protein
MYLLSLLEDLEAIALVPAFSPGGSGSNHICTCFVCYRSFEYKKSVVFIVKRGRLGLGNLNNAADRTGFQRRLPVRCGCVRRQVDMQR